MGTSVAGIKIKVLWSLIDWDIPTFISNLLHTSLRTKEVRADTSDFAGF